MGRFIGSPQLPTGLAQQLVQMIQNEPHIGSAIAKAMGTAGEGYFKGRDQRAKDTKAAQAKKEERTFKTETAGRKAKSDYLMQLDREGTFTPRGTTKAQGTPMLPGGNQNVPEFLDTSAQMPTDMGQPSSAQDYKRAQRDAMIFQAMGGPLPNPDYGAPMANPNYVPSGPAPLQPGQMTVADKLGPVLAPYGMKPDAGSDQQIYTKDPKHRPESDPKAGWIDVQPGFITAMKDSGIDVSWLGGQKIDPKTQQKYWENAIDYKRLKNKASRDRAENLWLKSYELGIKQSTLDLKAQLGASIMDEEPPTVTDPQTLVPGIHATISGKAQPKAPPAKIVSFGEFAQAAAVQKAQEREAKTQQESNNQRR